MRKENDWAIKEVTGIERILTDFAAEHEWFNRMFGKLLWRLYWPKKYPESKEEMLYRIRDVFRRIAEDQMHRKKSLFWAKLHYLLSKKLNKGKE